MKLTPDQERARQRQLDEDRTRQAEADASAFENTRNEHIYQLSCMEDVTAPQQRAVINALLFLMENLK